MPRRPIDMSRRAALTAALTPLMSLTNCAPAAPRDPGIPLASLPPGDRVRVKHGEEPIELQRGADGQVTARSLWCTHMGCEVRWRPEAGEYVCPCHSGRFDPDGVPTSGPPERPLRKVAVRLEGDRLIFVAPAG